MTERRRAFSLVELLVVVAIIALLASLLIPSLGRAKVLARRILCRGRLSQIERGAKAYTAGANGVYFQCRYRKVQIALNPKYTDDGSDDSVDWIKAAARVGLEGTVWECPNRPGSYQVEPQLGNQQILGYQYFGGIEKWLNPWAPAKGYFEARSPDRVDRAQPGWALAADCTIKVDGVWGGGRPSAYGNMPQHRGSDPWPEGGNIVYVNGSAEWVPFEKMVFIHNWHGDDSRVCYWYQEDLGEYDPPPEARAQP